MQSNRIFNICYPMPTFREVAEALRGGLGELGFTAYSHENVILPEAQNILLGAHLYAPTCHIPEGTILFNLEQLSFGLKWCDETYLDRLRCFPVWDYSERNISFLVTKGISSNVKRVPIGFSSNLQRIPKPEQQDIDVLFYGVVNERRRKILQDLRTAGMNVVELVGVFGEELDTYIARSKVVLNLHFYEEKIFEIVRVSYLLNNRKAVVSEVDPDTEIDSDLRAAVVGVPYDQLVAACAALVRSDAARQQIEDSGLHIFMNRPQSSFLKIALGLDAGLTPTTDVHTANVPVISRSSFAPTFTVVIPTHKRAKLLARAIRSVQAQTWPCRCIAVISDVEDTETYLAATHLLRDEDVFIQRQGTPGPAASRNLGMPFVKGDYLIFLDDDDSLRPDFLANLSVAIQQSPIDAQIFFTNCEVVNERLVDGDPVEENVNTIDLSVFDPRRVYVKNFIPNNCLVYPPGVLDGIEHDTQLAYEDWEFLLSACERAKLCHIPIFGPRIHKSIDSDWEQRGKSNEQQLFRCYLKIYAKHPAPNADVAAWRKALFADLGFNLDTVSVSELGDDSDRLA